MTLPVRLYTKSVPANILYAPVDTAFLHSVRRSIGQLVVSISNHHNKTTLCFQATVLFKAVQHSSAQLNHFFNFLYQVIVHLTLTDLLQTVT